MSTLVLVAGFAGFAGKRTQEQKRQAYVALYLASFLHTMCNVACQPRSGLHRASQSSSRLCGFAFSSSLLLVDKNGSKDDWQPWLTLPLLETMAKMIGPVEKG